MLVGETALTLGGLVVYTVMAAVTAVGVIAADVAADPVDAVGAVADAELAMGQGDLHFILVFHDSNLLYYSDSIQSDGTSTLDQIREYAVTGNDNWEIKCFDLRRHFVHDDINI